MTNGSFEARRSFEARLRAARLKPAADDLAPLEALVLDLDRAAAGLRGPLPYALEPRSALHLDPPAAERQGNDD